MKNGAFCATGENFTSRILEGLVACGGSIEAWKGIGLVLLWRFARPDRPSHF
jgi:hypothetical protein